MNVLQIISMIKNGGDPSSIVADALRSQNSPFSNNAADMIEKHDAQGIEQIARNMCASKGIDPDDAMRQVQKMLGL